MAAHRVGSREVDDHPLQVRLLGEPYVVFRTGSAIAVLRDRCPHRFAPLSRGTVVNGEIECGYHGWRFDAVGRCVGIPSLENIDRAPVKANVQPVFGVKERYGLVFVALARPFADVIDLPQVNDSSTCRISRKRFVGRFGAAQLLDNQLDTSHFAFLHRNTFGIDETARIPRYRVTRDADGWGFGYEMAVPISASFNSASGRAEIRRTMTYHFRAALQLSLEIRYSKENGNHSIGFFAQPETAERASFYVTSIIDRPGGFSDEEFADRQAFENRIGEEDRAMQSAFDDFVLPSSLATECHVQADRASVEFRRILALLAKAAGEDTPRHSRAPAVQPNVPRQEIVKSC